MTTSSRIFSALAYLFWIPAFYALTNPPKDKWCGKEHIEELFLHLVNAPIWLLIFGLVCVWRQFERSHWAQAFLVALAHSVIAMTILVVGCVVCIVPILGALVGIVIVFVGLPIWLFGGWALQLALSCQALLGQPPSLSTTLAKFTTARPSTKTP